VSTNRKPGFPRRLLALAWLAAVVASRLPAQDPTMMTRIYASAADANFQVDGQQFIGAAVFSWPAGSKHILSIDPWQDTRTQPPGRYVFQQWTTPAGALGSGTNLVTITADPGIPWYRADLNTEYTLTLVFYQCNGSPCLSPGTVSVNQVAYQQDAQIWLAAGSSVTLQATPNPGFVFTGWSQGPGLAPIYTFTLKAAAVVYPIFAVARPIQLLTSPGGFQLLADQALVTTPVTLDWGFNTTHLLAPVSPQFDLQGRQWVFQSWSDGGDRNHAYLVPPGPSTVSIVAQFVAAVPAMLMTDPTGLSLTVDGLDGLAPRFGSWGPGETHTVSAPLHQTDSAGNPWVFRQWSNGAGASQTIHVADADVATGIRMSASYDPRSRVRVESTPSGLALAVDGATCQTPCEVERAVGSVVQISAPSPLPAGAGMRLDFGSWEGSASGTITTVAGYQKVTAHYLWSYLLTLSMSPAGAGTFRLSPASGDGYYAAGSSVSIGIDASSGMKFRQWSQDLGGSANPATLSMDAPHAVQANFDKLADSPGQLRVANAAGDTPASAVAAGSIAVLFGDQLSDVTASSQADPLPQSLAGVSLVCSGHLLPLLFVSPKQINFQVPGDLAAGTYDLEVHSATSGVSTVKFDVARDAPGLLAATHLDGTAITTDSPAHPGEEMVLYATGLGPYQPSPIDGFRVPSVNSFLVVDPVAVAIAGITISPDAAVAAAGLVGISIVRVPIPADLAAAGPWTVTVAAGAALSNALPLPYQ